MPADYKSRATRKQKKSLPGYVWLLSGLAIGLFIAFIVYLDKQPRSDKDFGSAVQVELEKLKKQSNRPTPQKKDTPPAKKEQKFNFYTILPELEILIPENETRPPETKKSDNQAAKQYVLQVGSFQNLKDAEKLKANLAFLGLGANIQHVTVNGQEWHRVRTGPYQNKRELYHNQNILNNNDIHSISMELK